MQKFKKKYMDDQMKKIPERNPKMLVKPETEKATKEFEKIKIKKEIPFHYK